MSELLASYLGHFVDIQKEQLRVSLWSGERYESKQFACKVVRHSKIDHM